MFTGFVAIFIFPTVKDGSISDSLKNVRKSVLIYETIIIKPIAGNRGSLTVEY